MNDPSPPPSSLWHLADVSSPRKDAPSWVVGEFMATHEEGWSLIGRIGEKSGVPVVLDMSLQYGFPLNDRPGITGSLLQSIPLGRLVREMTERVAKDQRKRAAKLRKPPPPDSKQLVSLPGNRPLTLGDLGRAHHTMLASDHRVMEEFPEGTPRRGRRGMSDADSRALALRVLDMAGPGIVVRLADELSNEEGREIPVDTVRSRVKALVKRGYLRSRGAGADGYLPGERLLNTDPDMEAKQ